MVKGKKKNREPQNKEARVHLPAGSVTVITDRDRDWLSEKKEPEVVVRSEKARPAVSDRDLMGKRVVDADDLELGYVEEVSADTLKVGEGPAGEWLRIGRSYIGDIGKEITLLEPLQDLLEDLEVVDANGKGVGVVTDVVVAGDIVDGIIVKTPAGPVYIILEDICCIGGTLSLDITSDELKKRPDKRKKAK